MELSTVEDIRFENLEDLDIYFNKFKDYCERYQEIVGKDNFTFDIDIDYETTGLKVTLNFQRDDNPERDPQYN